MVFYERINDERWDEMVLDATNATNNLLCTLRAQQTTSSSHMLFKFNRFNAAASYELELGKVLN